eukprot:ANDGO_03977.mRNA.1 hypothetical protein
MEKPGMHRKREILLAAPAPSNDGSAAIGPVTADEDETEAFYVLCRFPDQEAPVTDKSVVVPPLRMFAVRNILDETPLARVNSDLYVGTSPQNPPLGTIFVVDSTSKSQAIAVSKTIVFHRHRLDVSAEKTVKRRKTAHLNTETRT